MHDDGERQHGSYQLKPKCRFAGGKTMSRFHAFAVRHSQVIRVASMVAFFALALVHPCADPVPWG
jgi:hypothetical protein